MGTKIVKNFIFITILLLPLSVVAQRKRTTEALRAYALCSCVRNNYQSIDSTFLTKNKDVTNSYIFQSNTISVETIKKLEYYVKEQTFGFYKLSPYGSYDERNANQVFKFCIDFYKSKKLKKYIKKIQ